MFSLKDLIHTRLGGHYDPNAPDLVFHKHHIVPRHEHGTNAPENIAQLTVRDHIVAHLVRWWLYQKWQDRIAWRALSRQISFDEAQQEAIREGARKGRMQPRPPSWNINMSKTMATLRWFTNGVENRRCVEAPSDEWREGRTGFAAKLWFTNGTENRRCSDAPGPEWRPGRTHNGQIGRPRKATQQPSQRQ